MKLYEVIKVLSDLQILSEGGAALKGTESITQKEANEAMHGLIHKIANELGIPATDIARIGSAGKKERPEALSGDIDLAVKANPVEINAAISNLAHDKKLYRAMPGLNVFAFAHKLSNGKLVQVDLMPTDNLEYAQWSLAAHDHDLKAGLKGAHRNELFFAIAKNANLIKRDEQGETVELDRYFYDLTRGLMRGTQSRKTDKKLLKNFRTINKDLISNDPHEISEILFGRGTSPNKVATFEGALDAILSSRFPYGPARRDILEMAAEGLRKKGLKVPPSLDARL